MAVHLAPFPRVEAEGVPSAGPWTWLTSPRLPVLDDCDSRHGRKADKREGWVRPRSVSPTDAGFESANRLECRSAVGKAPPSIRDHPDRMARPVVIAGLRLLRTPATHPGRPARTTPLATP